MTENDLIEKFKTMRKAATRGDNTRAMHALFGIIFDKDIKKAGSSAKAIADAARVKSAEISTGRKLASYVTVRSAVANRWRP